MVTVEKNPFFHLKPDEEYRGRPSVKSIAQKIVIHPQDAALILDFMRRANAEPWMQEVIKYGSVTGT
jgi:hypothetical protein